MITNLSGPGRTVSHSSRFGSTKINVSSYTVRKAGVVDPIGKVYAGGGVWLSWADFRRQVEGGVSHFWSARSANKYCNA